MRCATVQSCALAGLDAVQVRVEVNLTGGLPAVSIVGLPQTAVRESKDRVRAAIRAAGFRFPQVRVVINLAPADVPKRGSRFDLPIAAAVLLAIGELSAEALHNHVLIGELGLDGTLRTVPGVLPAAVAVAGSDQVLVLPREALPESQLSRGTRCLGFESLQSFAQAFAPGARPPRHAVNTPRAPSPATAAVDLSEVQGQATARRALEVAAAGGHSLLLEGPPGAGKSMLAACLPGILPPLNEQQALEVAALASISHAGFDPAQWGQRPFRAPHHSVTAAALIGGGHPPRPGEISLAHHGVLFLDELAEFRPAVVNLLREPLEQGHIELLRGGCLARFPARSQLIAACNPCPCGQGGERDGHCSCTPEQLARYRARLSGPLLDRIDLCVPLRRVPLEGLFHAPLPEGSAAVAARVQRAVDLQLQRQGQRNAQLRPGALPLQSGSLLHADALQLLERSAERAGLSVRVCHRLLRVARTLADLAGCESVEENHISEALSYRIRALTPDFANRAARGFSKPLL